MSDTGLTRLFAPRSVAVVGASPTEGKAGNALVRTLESFGGSVYPIHPKASEVRGIAAHASIGDVPDEVDLALLAIPAAATLSALEECAAAGVGGAVVTAGGFAETGVDGAGIQQSLGAIGRDGGMRLLGPNTSGFLAPPRGLFATFVSSATTVISGSLAIVAQSGGVNHALAFAASGAGVGVRLSVGLGNAEDVGFADVLDYLAEDEDTSAVALAIEGVADGRALTDAVERLADRVPVVALVLGRADVSDFAKSHTGALAAERPVARAALRQAGAVLVEDTTELLDIAAALSMRRLPARAAPGVGVVTGQAGPGLLLADALAFAGVQLPELDRSTRALLGEQLGDLTFLRNPIDTGRPGPSFAEVMRTVAQDDAVDAVGVYLLDEPDAVDPRSAFVAAAELVPVVLATAGPVADVAAVREDLARECIPVLPTPERAAAVIAGLVADSRTQFARSQRDAVAGGWRSQPAAQRPPRGWDEVAAKELLARIGIHSPSRRVCRDAEEAKRAADTLGPRVALKLLSPGLTHKTELGAVKLGIAPEDLPLALAELERVELVGERRYLVEAMAPTGPELLIGAIRDRVFGPLVMLASGGIEAEGTKDATTRLAPLSPEQGATMLDDLAGAFRYRGHRGAPAVDEQELGTMLAALGALLIASPEIAEIEVNPLRVTEHGLLALDSLVVPL